VLRAALALADEGGIESLTMRKLGQELGVEAMSLYNHVANKDDSDGIVELVLGEVGGAFHEGDWKTESVVPRSRHTRCSCATVGRAA
jgi:AcrR family transcriptional regulator